MAVLREIKKSDAQIEEERRCIKAHEIAKIACEKESTYWGALYLLELATKIIERYRDSEKPTAGEQPIDRYGYIIKPPTEETEGGED